MDSDTKDPTSRKSSFGGPIAWMTRNTVAANLTMMIFIIGGLVIGYQVKQEIFPEFQLDLVRVSVAYPGASPAEVEQGILLAIEDEVRSIDRVKKVTSSAVEGSGTITVELMTGTSGNKALQDVKNAVDRIRSLPEEAERPIVSLIEARSQVVSLILYGDQSETILRAYAEHIRDELLQIEGITLVDIATARPLEIGIEVPQELLRSYNLTLDNIAGIVRETALELPAGAVKGPSGEILLRTQERRDYAEEFRDIAIVARDDGTKVVLSDVATITDGFEETDQEAFFNGKRAMRLEVFRMGEQTPTQISDAVNDYILQLRPTLPEGIEVAVWDDFSELFQDRIELLMRNAFLGLTLVLLLLGLFLDPRLAFWVTMGIPVSIIGSFLFIPLTGATINMVSLFAFIVTLGIVVDDAVVVGEMIYQKREQGLGYIDSAVFGAREIAAPVCFAVLTNIAAFTPLFFIPGATGKIFLQIPAIVVSVFIVSLVESLYILPAHLSHERKKEGFWAVLRRPQRYVNAVLRLLIERTYRPSLRVAMRYHYATLAIGLAMLIIALGAVIGGHVGFSYLPRIDSDIVTAQAAMTFGSPIEDSRRLQKELVSGAQMVMEEIGQPVAKGLYTQIGRPITGGGPPTDRASQVGSHIVGVQVALVGADKRTISGQAFADMWRERVEEVAGTEVLTYSASIHAGGGSPIDIQLTHASTEILENAAQELAEALTGYAGVEDIDSGVSLGKPQLSFKLKSEARSLGITVRDLARQVRAAFYGSEALRQQRGRNEVKVLVRLPESERKTIHTVEELVIRSPNGGEITLAEAAEITRGRAYTDIKRQEGRRVISVTADIDEKVTNANSVISDVEKNILPGIIADHPGLDYSLEGQQREQRESLEAMAMGFLLAMVAIFALLAIPFGSYVQPIIVMLSIPFGIVGAIIGHVFLGYDLSIISMMGIIALSGVVVNDSLVMIVTTNRLRETDGLSAHDALLLAATTRFRPIILTSLTTFFGLAPMIFETSMQARFLIPMAISLGFGILFATFIILLITPATYLIVEDLRNLFRRGNQ